MLPCVFHCDLRPLHVDMVSILVCPYEGNSAEFIVIVFDRGVVVDGRHSVQLGLVVFVLLAYQQQLLVGPLLITH